MAKPVIIIGAGGHAKVLVDLVLASGSEIIGLTDVDASRHGTELLGCLVLGTDDIIADHDIDKIELVVGVGSTAPSNLRRNVYERYAMQGYTFQRCIHPSAIIGGEVEIKDGAQIMAGTVIQPGTQIGKNTIVNTRASIDHDCKIGDQVHVAPGVTLGGTVTIGDGAHIGTGSCIIENINIGKDAMIAAGACVVKDVLDGLRMAGVPAQEQSINDV